MARQRLTRTLGSRLGIWGAIAVLLFALGSGLVLVDDEPAADLTSLVQGAVRGLLWLGVGPLALSIAHRREERDRVEGVELLASLHGHDPGELRAARLVAAWWQATTRIGAPAVLLCLGLATFAWQSSAALVVQAVGLAAFAPLAGLVVGGLAALCGRWGGRRGWGLLLAAVIVPWALADVLGRPLWSLPGLLDETLLFLADVSWMTGGPR